MLRSIRCQFVVALCCAAAVLFAPAAYGGDKATAEALFREGKTLMKDGKIDQACQKFQASWEADPAIGALLNLALCHQEQGKTASAWVEFVQAADLAKRAGDVQRSKGAQQHADRLEATLSHLVIVAEAETPGLTVERDGTAVSLGSLDSPLPVDPGVHEITAAAPGHERWSTTITVGPDGDRQTVSIPALVLSPADEGGGGDPASGESSGAQGIAGWSLVGVGGAGLAVAVVLGIVAKGQVDDLEAAEGDCANQICTPEGREQLEDATAIAHGSTALYVIGGACLVSGVVLLLTEPSDDEGDPDDELAAMLLPTFGPSGAGLTVSGRF